MAKNQNKQVKIGHANKVQAAVIGLIAFSMCMVIGCLLLYMNVHSSHQDTQTIVMGFAQCCIGFLGIITCVVFLMNSKSPQHRVNDAVPSKGMVSKANILYRACATKESLIEVLQEFVAEVQQDPNRHEVDEILLANQLKTIGIMDWEDPIPLSCYTYISRAAKAAGNENTLAELIIPLDRTSPYAAITRKIANALNLLNTASEEISNHWNGGVVTARSGRIAKAERDALLNVLTRTPDPFNEPIAALDTAGYKDQSLSSEWGPRRRILKTLPDLRLPASCYYDLRMNHKTRVALLDVTVPSPEDLSFLSCNDLEEPLPLLACAYALRVSLLVGRTVFATEPVIKRVVVLAHEDETEGAPHIISSMDLTREGEEIERLSKAFASGSLDVPDDPAVRCNVNAQDGWVEVEPHITFTDKEVAPEEWVADTLGNKSSLPSNLAAVVYTSSVDGLSFSPFSKLHDRQNEPEGLKLAVSHAREMEKSDTVDHRAITELLHTALLDADYHSYDDTDKQVWRWFASAADRIAYNRMHTDDTRSVRILPDAVASAILLLVRNARDSNQFDMALTWANENVRISPLSSIAHDGRCSLLLEMERLHEAEEEWKEFLLVATTPFDIAAAFYRLAFLEWKLGRSDLAAACYSRCCHFDTPWSVPAEEEAKQLSDREPSLTPDKFSFVDRMKRLIDAGIDVCLEDKRCEQLLSAAVLCMDNNLFLPAFSLIGTLRAWDSKEVNLSLLDSLGIQDRIKSEEEKEPAKADPVTAATFSETLSLSGLERADNLIAIFKRSDNILATIKDYVRHESSVRATAGILGSKLARMLNLSGIMEWDNPPVTSVAWLESGHCSIKHTFSEDTSFEERLRYLDIMTSCEAALNIVHDAAVLLGEDADTATVKDLDETCDYIVDGVLRRQDAQLVFDNSDLLEGIADIPRKADEWEYRTAVSTDVLRYPFPLRCNIDFRCNLANHVSCMILEVPRASVYAFLDEDPLSSRVHDVERSRMYTLRTALVAARIAFRESDSIERVVVLCYEMEKGSAILSLDLSRQNFLALCVISTTMQDSDFASVNTQLASYLQKEGRTSPKADTVRFRLDDDGGFLEVEPHLSSDDDLLNPDSRHLPVKTDSRACSADLSKASGAHLMSDFEVDEAAGRFMAWICVKDYLGENCSQAVRSLTQLLNYAKGEQGDFDGIDREKLDTLPQGCIDKTVIDACMRTSIALVDGTLESCDKEAVANHFLFTNPLSFAVRSVNKQRTQDIIKGKTPSPEEIHSQMDKIEKALESWHQKEQFVDTQTTVWRSFDSLQERIIFNRLVWDGRSQVNLVPNAYLVALHLLADCSLMLNMTQVARSYIEESMHLHPTGVYERNLQIRLLEQEDRLFEAEQSLKEGLHLCGDESAAGIYYYRLAYIEWKLGRNDVCSACYAESERYSSQVQEQAHNEYEELIADGESDVRRISLERAGQILMQEGIEANPRRQWSETIEQIARITCNMGSFQVAKPLVAQLFNESQKDVYKGIYYSLGSLRQQ